VTALPLHSDSSTQMSVCCVAYRELNFVAIFIIRHDSSWAYYSDLLRVFRNAVEPYFAL